VTSAPAESPRIRDSGLQEKLEWLMLFRLVLVTLLLGSAVIVNVNDADSFSDPSYVAIAALIIGTYVATLGYAWRLRGGGDLGGLALVQLVGDIVLAGGLVLLTGGTDSIFTFLFFLTIFNGAVLTGRRGAMFAASGSSVTLAMIAVLQFAEVPWVDALLPETAARGRVPVYAMVIHLVSFYTVGYLAATLAEKLGQVGSELERRQLDLRALRVLHENIVRSISSGLVTLDTNGRVIYMNRAALEISGLGLGDVLGRPLSETAPKLGRMVSVLEADADVRRVEDWYENPAQNRVFIAVTSSPLLGADEQRTGTILVLQDMTEVKGLQDEMAQRSHLAAIGNLSAAIAHEIRNPLAAISGSIEVLRMSASSSADDRTLMDIVVREVDRLNALVRDFLNYARPMQIDRRKVVMTELVDDTVAFFERDQQLASGVHIEVRHETGPFRSRVDPERVQQVLWNLLRNACEAMNGSGEIRVSTAMSGGEGDRFAIVSIEDSGPGLPSAAIDRIFEPFYTTKPSGTGLGLATSHRIVSEHGGLMRAENREQGGARFVIVLPSGETKEQTQPSTRMIREGERFVSGALPRILTEEMGARMIQRR
jgi:two-component system sensor histidine kinase PilS (NtrC family)